MDRFSGRRGVAAAVAVVGLTLTLAAVAFAGAPKAGKYTARGAIKFTFRLTPGHCYLPPKNLKNYKARRGKYGKGLCFTSNSEPPVHVKCPNNATVGGLTAGILSFGGLRLPGNGVLHLKAYTYSGASAAPVYYTEIDLKVRGSRASGYVRQTFDDGGTCDSGKLAFTAKAG
jgi:hypothetical protein